MRCRFLRFLNLDKRSMKVISEICNVIWKTGRWRKKWTKSVFLYLYKKGSAKDWKNFRTTPLISCVIKITLSDGNCVSEVKRCIERAKDAMIHLKKIWKKKGIGIKTKIRLSTVGDTSYLTFLYSILSCSPGTRKTELMHSRCIVREVC